jgi:hypothetical protein
MLCKPSPLLAREHATALTFPYLPEYQGPEQLGTLWTPPGSLSNRKLWFDVNHLNYRGAASLAPWLAAELTDTEKAPPAADSRGAGASAELHQ